jgi:OmpA-OmpF porin, OOP family
MKPLWIAFFILMGASLSAWPQAPSAEQMIEQLKVKPEAVVKPALTGRTRGLGGTRNLTVDSATAQEAAVAAEKPSLSLQIQFDFNSASIRPESQQALTNLATALQSKDLAIAKFAVEGHTDAKGRVDYNQRLSQHRADAVREFLMSKGVDSSRLSAMGKGSSDPSNKDDPNAAENRRVKIVNLQ